MRQEDKEFFRNFPLVFWLLFIVFGVVLLIPIMIYIGFSAKAFTGEGQGYSYDPYQIATCEQLQEIGENPGKFFVITQDIDCSDSINWNDGAGFEPMNGENITFDGRNHAITGLYINRPTAGVGLFGYLQINSQIKNLRLVNNEALQGQDALTGGMDSGAIATGTDNTVEISNVHSELNIRIKGQEHTNALVGGLVGVFRGTTLAQSSSTGNVTIENSDSMGFTNIGGLVGVTDNYPSPVPLDSVIQDSYSSGTVRIDQNGTFDGLTCGGLVGTLDLKKQVQNSYSTSTVSCNSSGSVTGGLIGSVAAYGDAADWSVVTNSFFAGSVPEGTDNTTNGLIGYLADPGFDISTDYLDVSRSNQTDCAINNLDGCVKVNINDSDPNYFFFNADNPPLNSYSLDIWFVNVDAAPGLRDAAVTPDPPTSIIATRAGANISLAWDAPANSYRRGEGISDYKVEYKKSTDVIWIEYDDGVSTDSTATIPNLDLTKDWQFRVRAVNDIGDGLYSEVAEILMGVPDKVTNLQGSVTADNATISWDAEPLASDYKVEYKLTSDTDWKTQPVVIDQTNRQAKFRDLIPGSSYQFRVFAHNSKGNGEKSDTLTLTTINRQSYSITNCVQLQNMKNDLSGAYSLANNIDCSDTINWNESSGFTPVGGKTDMFSGSLDGNGHTISNLYINKLVQNDSLSPNGVGLFGITYNASVENIKLKNTTVVGRTELSPEIDANQDGIADVQSPVSNAKELASLTRNQLTTYLFEIYGSALINSSVGVGSVAGLSGGNSQFKNITSDNGAIIGGMSGGLIGAVMPSSLLMGTFLGAYGINYVSNDKVNIENVNVSGNVSGVFAGGVTAVVMTDILLPDTTAPSVNIKDATSTATIDGNIAGGLAGITVSPMTFLVFLSKSATLDYATSAITTKTVQIANSHATGEVSTCNAISYGSSGMVGGLVGIGLGLHIKDSYASGRVSLCDKTLAGDGLNTNLNMFGGSAGGLAGALMNAQIDTSYANGQVGTKLADGATTDSNINIFTGTTGGLVGTFLSAGSPNGQPLINKSYATGNIINETGAGNFNFNGGLVGMLLGSGTVEKSYATGSINNGVSNNGPYGLSVNGGLIGLGGGADISAFEDAIFQQAPTLTQGLVINKSYASGNVKVSRTKSGKSALLSVSGGLGGVFVGDVSTLNSRATGNVTNDVQDDLTLQIDPANIIPIIAPDPIDEASTLFALTPAPGLSVAGGLVGVGVGVSSQQLIEAAGGVEIEPTGGVVIDNSYANGKVTGTVAGGLMGYTELRATINKAYAEGDVTGTTVGGLIGGSGAGSLGLSIYLGNLVYNTATKGTPVPGWGQGLIKAAATSVGPLTVTNTYTTSDITAYPLATGARDADGQPYTFGTSGPFNVTNLPTLAGGMIGLNASPGGVIHDSYASGSITIKPQKELSTYYGLNFPNIPSAAGGLFGLAVGMPQANLKNVYEITQSEDPNASVEDYFTNKSDVKNVFSAATINPQPKTFTGAVAGFFGSPIGAAFQNAVPQDKLFNVSNLYYDRMRVNLPNCNGPANPVKSLQDILSDTNIVQQFSSGTNDPKILALVDNYEMFENLVTNTTQYQNYIAPFFVKTTCSPVNKDNSQPKYFKDNKVNAPLNKWNFSNVWVTQKTDYPKFTAGPESGDPTPIPDPPKVTTVTKNNPGDPQVGGAGTPVPALAALLNPDQVKAKKDNWLVSLLRKIPEPIAKTIPYALLLILIAITLFYTYSTLLEKHRRKQLQLIIRRIYASAKARATYLSIISHYLNTPLTKMRSTVELLHSTKKIPDEVNKAVSKELSSLAKSTDTLLTMGQNLTMNQQNDIKNLEAIKLPSVLMKPAVWLPISVLYTLTLLANILFVYADRYDINGMMILTQVVLGLIGGATLAVSYYQLSNAKKLRLALSRQADVEKSTAQQQGQFIDNVYSALSDELDSLSTFTKEISSHPKSEGFKAGINELHIVVDKMDKVATLSRNIPGVIWRTNATQTLKNVMSSLRPLADKAGVSIQSSLKSTAQVNVDDKSLTHLFSAPISNAVQFSKSGSKVNVALEHIDKSVVLTVADTGKGIAEKQLIQLFEPFSRFEATQQFDHQGMGLDLYLCQVITEHYGGSVVLISKEGQGTTARIKIPVSPAA